MRKFLFLFSFFTCFMLKEAWAQPATYSVPFAIGKDKCGSGGVDSVYFFNYANSIMSRASSPAGCKPVLKPKTFSISAASVSFNPKDHNMYYIWTDYTAPLPARSYIWKWDPTTCPSVALDTIKKFNFDIGGITFDPTGFAWQLEFSGAAPYKAYLRQLDFTAGVINGADTLDLTAGAGGIGDTIYNVSSGDITMTPSGQMYFIFDNKLYTPDYGSYGNATHHIKATFIDSVKKPAGTTFCVGLAFAAGDLIASYSPGCVYKKIDPVTGDTSWLTYNYAANKGVASSDMSQINSGVGAAKKLVSVTATGTPNQYDVIYDVYVRNYGSVSITNVQVTDDLTTINGAANLSNVTAAFTSNPAGMVLNAAYNGNSNINLLNAGQTLVNYPAANNNFTIRISCRLSNIQAGVVYNNSAIATANGFSGAALRDSSTNGSNPDLNQNDKPDDLGEGQPTPFVIILTPTTPPCSVLSQVLYTNDFGTGVGLSATPPASPSISMQYIGTATAPVLVNRYTLTNNAATGDPSNWISLADHTGNLNGRMLEVNADGPAYVFYRDTLPVACPGQQYSMSFWTAFIGNATYQTLCAGLGGFKYPKFLIRMRDLATGLTITQFTTADITSTSWQQLGMKWVMPSGYTNIIMEMLNAGPGGCGNDFVLDDVQYGICDPLPTVSINNPLGTCLGGSVTFTGALSDPAVIPGTKDYQWQWSPAPGSGPWTNIGGATSVNYTINPVTATDTGRYYRVIIAATGNIGIVSCQYISPGARLIGETLSTAATAATKSKNSICPGISVNLGITGGSLGTNASWKWYSGSCSGTLVGTGSTISVTPLVTTTYYVLAQGDCNTTTCVSVTVTIACNIDKDKDGIPDYVESNMAAALQDANSNGIINAYDPAYPGFVDNNGDFINDNFQADGDSDNDGIPNYLDLDFPGRVDSNADGVDDRFDTDKDGIINMLDLDSDNDGIPDVVEANGVDTNGDALLDNFIDADGDGLGDRVDANTASAYNSGQGLGNIDFDGDGVPNYLDLDSDNDGIPDVVEVGGPDTNNDGKADAFVDANNDGLHDGYINATALLKTGADANADGRADSYPNKNMDNDFRPSPYDVDSDGDGIVDVVEAGLPDANMNGIVDGIIGANGWSTSVSALAALNLRNTDADAKQDYQDIDSDNDGITDNIEGQTTNSYLLPVATDTDGDGLVDTYDNVVGFSGGGIFPVDMDGDTIPDYRDSDTDGDGQIDRIEGNDFNFNRLPDDLVTLTGIDTDGDGLDDRFDNDNASPKVTSAYMGNGGSFSGPASPGTRSVVQMSWPTQNNRDWRYVGNTLPVNFLQFNGMLQLGHVQLNWSIITSKEIDHFEIERSLDNNTYTMTGMVTDAVNLNVAQQFGFNDDIAGINSEIIYYRLKVIGKAGEIKYSNILVVRRTQTKTPINIMPNPASDYVSVRFFAEKESIVTLRLIDNLGKTVMVQQQKVLKGSNTLQINNLYRYSNGVYSLQVIINDEVVTQKLVLAK